VGDELANGSLPWAVTPDELTDALRRAGILRNGRVVEVTADELRTTVLSRVGRLHLTYEGRLTERQARYSSKPDNWSAQSNAGRVIVMK
jgi:hypothetical protein